MAYTPTNWQARTGSGLNRFVDQNGNILELTASPTEVINAGTPVTADNLNHMEEGIEAAHEAIDEKADPGLLVTGLSLPTSGYSGSGPYTISITATGVATTAIKVYELIPVFSATAATRALEKAAWNLIDLVTISSANTLGLTLTAVPTTAVPFVVKECP